jgi:hypothetical protein
VSPRERHPSDEDIERIERRIRFENGSLLTLIVALSEARARLPRFVTGIEVSAEELEALSEVAEAANAMFEPLRGEASWRLLMDGGKRAVDRQLRHVARRRMERLRAALARLEGT